MWLLSRYWTRRARIGVVLSCVVGLPAPARDMLVEGCPETQFVGFTNYRCIDYCGEGCQSDVGSLKLGNHDYSVDRTVNAEVHHSCCGRNSCTSGGGPDDSANDHSCGVMDWGNKGAPTDTGYPYGNNPFWNCPLVEVEPVVFPWPCHVSVPWRWLLMRLRVVGEGLNLVDCTVFVRFSMLYSHCSTVWTLEWQMGQCGREGQSRAECPDLAHTVHCSACWNCVSSIVGKAV